MFWRPVEWRCWIFTPWAFCVIKIILFNLKKRSSWPSEEKRNNLLIHVTTWWTSKTETKGYYSMMKFCKKQTTLTMEVEIVSVVAYGQGNHWKRTEGTFWVMELYVSWLWWWLPLSILRDYTLIKWVHFIVCTLDFPKEKNIAKSLIVQVKESTFRPWYQALQTFIIQLLNWDIIHKGFPGGSVGKETTCQWRKCSSIPGSGRSPGKGNSNPLQYSCLGNPMDRGAWRLQSKGVQGSNMT